MFRELIITSKSASSNEIYQYATVSVDKLCVPSLFINRFVDVVPNVAALIDFPYGLSPTKVRMHEIIYAAKAGAKTIDLTLNNSYLADCNFKSIIGDLADCLRTAEHHSIDTRVILEHTLFPADIILDLIDQIKHLKIFAIITSTGTLPASTSDDIILCKDIMKLSGIATYSCSVYTDQQYENYKKINIRGLRFNSVKLYSNLMKSIKQ